MMSMYIYVMIPNRIDREMYAAAVVIAGDETEARRIHPAGLEPDDDGWLLEWVKPEHLMVFRIGTADDRYTKPSLVMSKYSDYSYE